MFSATEHTAAIERDQQLARAVKALEEAANARQDSARVHKGALTNAEVLQDARHKQPSPVVVVPRARIIAFDQRIHAFHIVPKQRAQSR